MFELTVYRQLYATVPEVVEHEVHIVYLIGVRIIDILLCHLSCRHVQELHRPVSRTILVDTQPEIIIRFHAAVAHKDEGAVVLNDFLELRILIDETSLAPAFIPCLGNGRLVEVRTLLQRCHVKMVAARVEVMIGTDAESPSLADGCRHIRVHHLTAKMIQRIVQLALELITSQLRLAVDAIGDDAIFQDHVLRSHRANSLMAYATVPRLIGIDLVIIVRHGQAVLVDIGISRDRQAQRYLAGLRGERRIHQHIPVAVARDILRTVNHRLLRQSVNSQ